MQKNTESRIAELLNAYRRKRKWKVMTIILSVVVLFNTIYAMRDAAVAVTERNANAAQLQKVVNEALLGSARTDVAHAMIRSEFTPDATGEAAPNTGESTENTAPVENSNSAPAEQPATPAEGTVPAEQPATPAEGTVPAEQPVTPAEGTVPAEQPVTPAEGTVPAEQPVTPAEGTVPAEQPVTPAEEVIPPVVEPEITVPAEEVPVPEAELPEELPEVELPEEEEEEVLGEVREVVPVTLETYVGETRIVVSFMSDAFEETVTLDAKEITAENTEKEVYEQLIAAVEEAAEKYGKFAAEDVALFDIYFLNEYGTVTEPKTGSDVFVSISTTGKETPDAEDVAEVLHIREENGVYEAERMHAEIYIDAAEFTTDSFSPYGVVKAPAAGRTEAARIESARPNLFQLTDAYGNKVTQAQTGAALWAEIGWQIDDMSEIAVSGDWLEIDLPEGLEFTSGTGEFVMNETVRLPDGTVVWPGQIVATFTFKDGKLRVVHTETAVQLNSVGKLASGLNVGEREWMRVKVSGVRLTATQDFNPAISLNGKSVSHGQIRVLAQQPSQLTDVRLTAFLVNGVPEGRTVEVGVESPVTIEIRWDWRDALRYLIDGDYYEIELPNQLSYQALDDTSTDEKGNTIRVQVIQREDKKWVSRVTYIDVVTGYNQSSGRVIARGHFVNPPALTNGSANVTLRAHVAGSTDTSGTRTRTVTVKKGSGLPPGTWHIRGGSVSDAPGVSYAIYDFRPYGKRVISYLRYNGDPETLRETLLYVLANHDNKPLNKDPFNRTRVVDYEPGISDYIVGYCAEFSAGDPWGSGIYDSISPTTYTLHNIDNVNITGKDKLKRFLPVSYPYVSIETMKRAVGNTDYITPDIAATAVQMAVWAATREEEIDDWFAPGAGGDDAIIRGLAEDLLSYRGSSAGVAASSYQVSGTPTVEWLDDTTVRVTGYIAPTPVPDAIKGVWTNGKKSVDVQITNRQTGRFTATLPDVSKNDHFDLRFSGTILGAGRVLYFQTKQRNPWHHDHDKAQDIIAAENTETPVYFDWSYECKERTVRVVKKWTDENGNEMATAPDKDVQVTLYRNIPGGQQEIVPGITNPVTLSRANGFTYTWKGLPLTDANGRAYHYTVKETKVPQGYVLIGVEPDTADNGKTLVFTAENREFEEKTRVKVVKKWQGVSTEEMESLTAKVELWRVNLDGTKTLMRVKNGKATDVPGQYRILTGEFNTTEGAEVREVLHKDNHWTVIFEGLPKYHEDGKTLVQYEVVETDAPQGFAISYEQPGMASTDPTATITNTKNVTKLKVIKYWEGVPDALKQDMKAVVQLFRVNYFTNATPTKTAVRSKDLKNVSEDPVNGLVLSGTYSARPDTDESDGEIVTATLTKNNNWSVTFENLPRYEEDGVTPIQYIVQEIAVYDAEGNEVSADFVIEYGPAMFKDRQGCLYAQPDVYTDGVVPTATVKNITEGTLRVEKKWIDADGNPWTVVFPNRILVKISATLFGKPVPENVLKDCLGGGPLTAELTAANDWSYSWANAAKLPGLVYYVEEVTREPETGRYELWDPVTGVPVDGSIRVEWNKEKKIFEVILHNRRRPAEIELIKYDADDVNKLLPGAEFTLYQSGDLHTPLGTYPTGADGKLRIGGLVHGTEYVLVETKWPEGYVERGNPVPIIFRVEADKVTGKDYIVVISGEDYANGQILTGAESLTLKVKNVKTGVVLPEAGGEGTNGYMAGGMSIMIATLLMYITWQYMCNKGKRGASK